MYEMSSVGQSAIRPFPPRAPWVVGGSAQEEDLLLVAGVLKPAVGVEDIELIDVLDIALTKSKTHAVSHYKEVKSVESFGLDFGNGWDVGRLRAA